MTKIKLNWDGDKIKQEVEYTPTFISPKEMIEAIDDVKNKINQMNDDLKKLEEQKKAISANLHNAKVYLAGREKFYMECESKCLDRLNALYDEVMKEGKLLKESEEKAEEISLNAGNGMTEEQKINQVFVIFQNKFATSKKVAENIPASMIRKHIFEKPFFKF